MDEGPRPSERRAGHCRVLVQRGTWGPKCAIGSLLLAGHDSAGRLVAVGHVGTGFSMNMRRHLFGLLDPLRCAESPLALPVEAAGVRWVSATYVGEVAYREYVPGQSLRHASWKGLRDNAVGHVRVPFPVAVE